MQRCKDPLKREFYLRMTRKFGRSKKVLIHQIENQSYEKSLLGQTSFERTLTPELHAQAKIAVSLTANQNFPRIRNCSWLSKPRSMRSSSSVADVR
jgi:predicted nuclease of restriction endonuclease-like (RecB) superfamily